MKAVDTNILVRLIVEDDNRQLALARQVVAAGMRVTLTVLLELGWTLTRPYGFDRARLNQSILDLLDLPGIHVDDEPHVRAALALHRDGADFADAIHLVAARGSDAFVTFDGKLRGGTAIGVEIEHLV